MRRRFLLRILVLNGERIGLVRSGLSSKDRCHCKDLLGLDFRGRTVAVEISIVVA